uniref:Sushi domain-containing protein n=1 Tax=Athene cunicularia TaxID=194338 RepID=A0A663MDJ2_ATHCN
QVVKCLPPLGIANGEHSRPLSGAFAVGALVHYRCKHGFSLIGSKSVRCTAHGVWSHPLPRCEGVSQTGVPGDIITIECNTAHVPKDLHKSQCQPGGTGALPLLTFLHCSKPADIAHGSLSDPTKAFFTPGTAVSYICEPGFSLIGTASIYCTQSGAWSHPPPVCQAVKCLHPPNITNGKLKGNISDTFSYGASVSYSCNPGYSLVGNALISCTGSGTWSQPPPHCKEIRCVFPEVQGVKKSIKGNTYRSGTNITLECDDGYTLEGISQIQCQEDFSWDPPVPVCKLRVAAAGVLLLLGAGIVWKILSKQKQG